MMEENNGKEGKTTLSRPDEQENRLIVSPNNGSSVKAASVASWFQRLYRRWWRSNRESLHRRERRGREKGREREGRDERVPRQQLRVRFHQLTYSTLYWMATPNSKRHPHPPKSHVFRIFSAHPITPSRFFNFNYIISTYRYISIYILSFPMWCSTRKNNAFSRLGKNRSKNIRFAQLNRFRIINAFSS